MSTYTFAISKLSEIDRAAVSAYPANHTAHWEARFAYRERELRRLLQCKLSAEAREFLQKQLDVLLVTL